MCPFLLPKMYKKYNIGVIDRYYAQKKMKGLYMDSITNKSWEDLEDYQIIGIAKAKKALEEIR